MSTAQKWMLYSGIGLVFIGLLFGIPMALHKNYTADGIGGVILTVGQLMILASVGVGMLARGE